MIKAIVFDLGGVLVNLDLDVCIKTFIDVLGYEDITRILDPYHQKGIYSDLEEGLISPDEFRAMVLAGSRPGARPEDVDYCMGSLLTEVDSYKVPLLNELAKEYPLYLLTNNNPISMARCHEAFEEAGLDYRKVFREEFVSSEMKMLKPGSAIFDETVRRVGFKPSEILFIDDSKMNVEGAADAGLKALLYVQGQDLEALIREAVKAEEGTDA